MKEEFKKDAEVIVEIANERGIDSIKSIVEKKLKQAYDEGHRQGIDDAWPWVLVNDMDHTEKPFGLYWDEDDDEAAGQFKEVYEDKLTDLIEAYLDLSEYETYDEMMDKLGEKGIDPIIIGLQTSFYLRNRYTNNVIYGDFPLDFIAENWDSLT